MTYVGEYFVRKNEFFIAIFILKYVNNHFSIIIQLFK